MISIERINVFNCSLQLQSLIDVNVCLISRQMSCYFKSIVPMCFRFRNNDFTLNDGKKERSRIAKKKSFNNSQNSEELIPFFYSLRISEMAVIIILLRNRDYWVDFIAEFNSNFKEFNWTLLKWPNEHIQIEIE